jgi:DNA-binding NtrC family response regulator
MPLGTQPNPEPYLSAQRQVGQTRILVVEDDAGLRHLVSRAVEDWGFPVTAVGSGEEAAELCQTQAFDIAILDLRLPGMDGIETLLELRRRLNPLQGIVLTGSATIDAARRAIHLDVVEFLTKPCDRGALEQAIDRARRRLAKTLPSRQTQIAPDPTHNLAEIEKRHILDALQRHNGDRNATARELGIARKTLYNKLKSYTSKFASSDATARR